MGAVYSPIPDLFGLHSGMLPRRKYEHSRDEHSAMGQINTDFTFS